MNPDHASRRLATAPALHVPVPVTAAISAWMDGDLAYAADTAVPDMASDAEIDTWHRFHLIGDVLRAGSPADFACSDAARSSDRARAFARDIVAQAVLASGHAAPLSEAMAGRSPVVSSHSEGAEQRDGMERVFQTTALASTPVVDGVTSRVASAPSLPRQPAANDDVYRWKLVAGFASVAAVAAVAWSVVGGSAVGPGEGAVMARVPATANVTMVSAHLTAPTSQFAIAASEPVWVSTPQGAVWRDPRMEELMRTHRQAGGGPALQVPAGFLRAATHDVSHR